MFMGGLPVYVYAPLAYLVLESRKRASDSLDLEIKMVLSYHIRAGMERSALNCRPFL